MKNSKKLVFGLSLAFFGWLFVFSSPAPVSAEVIKTQAQIEAGLSTLEFKNRAVIEGTFAGQLIQFVDEDPYDTTYNYKPQGDFFCSTGATVNGINIQNNAIATSNAGRVASSVLALVDLDYNENGVANHGQFSPGCKGTSPNDLRAGVITGGRAFITMEWDGNELKEVNGVKGASTFVQLGDSGRGANFLVKDKNNECFGNKVVFLENNNFGTIYEIRNSQLGEGRDAYEDSVLKEFYTRDNQCYITSTFRAGIFGVRGVQSSSSSTVGSEDNSSDCIKENNSGLEWWLCPVTSTLGAAVGKLDDEIKQQLDYDVTTTLANNGGAHAAWSIIKNLATAVLVIVMLVMVFSQAFGNGVFEAYTVKKMLPRLVIAVIVMQISWEICKWLITLANDLGNGLGELMAAPFGGDGNLDLNSILSKLGGDWPLDAQFIIPAILFTAIVGAVALPGAFALALAFFLGVLAAILMLMFRNVLILALTILAPLAILVWILPGKSTEAYWKLWKDNFTKLLLLFPLIIAIIYAGQIFAYVAAGAAGDTDPAQGFLDFLLILVAYFGPYFIIFKAYGWGGSILSSAGNIMDKGSKGLQRGTSPLLKTLGERAQGNLADRYAINSSKAREFRARRDRARELGLSSAADWDKRYRAANRKDRFKRGLFRVASGNPLPTTRSQVETLAKASAYKKDLVDKKVGLIHSDYVEELSRNGGDVKGAKEYIRDKYDIGNTQMVMGPNGKPMAMTNELGDPVTLDKYTERAVKNWYVDTKSAMELGDQEWRLGAITGTVDKAEFLAGGRLATLNKSLNRRNNGDAGITDADIEREAAQLSRTKRTIGYKTDQNLTLEDIVLRGKRPKLDLAKTTGFMAMMNADPNRYAYVATNLPTLQPFNQELGGGPKRTDYLPEVRDASGSVVRERGSKLDETIARLHRELPPVKATEIETILMRGDDEAEQLATYLAEDSRAQKWMDNMESPAGFAAVRPEHYQIMEDVKEHLEKYGLKSQSAATLRTELDKLAEGTGIEGKSILQKLMGGKMSATSSIAKLMDEPGYLENKLGVTLKDPVVVAAGGREGTLASQKVIQNDPDTGAEPPERKDFRYNIITDSQRPAQAQTIAKEFVKSLGEMEGYADAAHSVTQQELKKVFSEIRDSARGDAHAARGFNGMIDNVIGRLNARVERAARNAVAQNKPPQEVERIKADARAAANREIAEYESQRIPVPTPNQYSQPIGPLHEDGTLIVDHGPSTIVTPSSPEYRPPNSTQLPGS